MATPFPQEQRQRCQGVAEILKNLSHPSRLMILCILSQGEQNVSELVEATQLSQPSVSQFLKQMKNQNILSSDKRAQSVFYSISNTKVLALMQSLHEIYGDSSEL